VSFNIVLISLIFITSFIRYSLDYVHVYVHRCLSTSLLHRIILKYANSVTNTNLLNLFAIHHCSIIELSAYALTYLIIKGTIMLPSLQTLLSSANAITSNSEPLSWDVKHTKVFFENQNNGERFYLYLDQEANNYSSEGYRFHLLDSDLSIELQFYTYTLITPETLRISH